VNFESKASFVGSPKTKVEWGMFRLRSVAAFLGLLLLLIAVGCGGGSTNNTTGSGSNGNGNNGNGNSGSGGSTAPTVTSFAVSPTLVAPGEFVNFSWATTNATGFTVAPAITNDDEMTLPLSATAYSFNTQGMTQSTQFQAVATSGTTMSQPLAATLNIVPVMLSASANMVLAGQQVTLTYSGPNNGSTSWQLTESTSNTPIPLTPSNCSGNTCSGTVQSGPLAANTTFQVSINGPAPTGGQAFSQQIMVTVEAPTTLTFTASPQTVAPGGQVTLTWMTTNAASVAITCSPACNPQIGTLPLSGSTTQNPQQTTTYTATATSIYPGAPPVMATATVTVSTGGLSNINHIIYMIQENRAFDNYFGVLAEYRVNHQPPIQGAQLSDVNDLHTLPSNYQICNPQGGCFGPFHARTECIENLSPSWDETHYDMDLVGNDWLNLTQNSMYKMDRFLDTTLSGGTGDQYDPTHSRPLGYYDQTDLPYYYELATQFTTDDSWYSPEPANTIPNRMYLFAATSYGHAFPPTSPSDPAWQQPTIFRALTEAGVTWRYYYQDNSVFLANWADWNNPQIQGNVRNIQEYYNILASPNADQMLPQVVFIERASSTGYDEHPGNNVQTGSVRAENAVNALLTSAAWPDSVFILTWDEGGGLFDHVGPILVTPPGDFLEPQDLKPGDQSGEFNVSGFRIPLVVLSPWVKPQTVVHLPADSTSILHLIEERFNVPALTQRDATAADMADPTNGFFDFSSPQLLQPPTLPTQPTNGTCSYQLEGHP
jgi:phospholipase C